MEHPVEVEFKFPVDALKSVKDQLLELGATPHESQIQEDEYLNDPVRDFRTMDIALRIRRVESEYCLTFKGPNLDPTAKIRTEIETQLVDQQAAKELRATFLGIGFSSVAKVVKKRETLTLVWDYQVVEVCLDEVEEVGSFIELEIVVERREEVAAAKECLESLGNRLGLSGATRGSYLGMLLKNRGQE